jgi:hypothetical protein
MSYYGMNATAMRGWVNGSTAALAPNAPDTLPDRTARTGPKKNPLKGVPNYWPACVRYSVFFCSCWRLRSVRGASKTRRRIGVSSGVSAAYTCHMFCERKFSANTILRLSKMSVHAEFPGESQFY